MIVRNNAETGCWKRCLLLLALIVALSSAPQAAESGILQSVRFEPQVFSPAKGQSTSLFFYLANEAEITATLYDSDHFPIATIAEKRPGKSGTNQIAWNGRDDQGNVVPDEAYYAVLTLADGSSFDPTLVSGGEMVGVGPATFDQDKGGVSFALSQAARVRLRAGIHEGPLHKTLLDWAPLTEGSHFIPWDGKDASGSATIWDHTRFNMAAEAYALPQAAVITAGSSVSTQAYWTGVAKKENADLLAYRLSSTVALAASDKARRVSTRALLSPARKLHKDGFANQFLNREPSLSVGSAKQGSDDPHLVNISIALDEFSNKALNETRYEYVLYVDNIRQEEKETGYSPYTWTYNTKSLPAGDHIFTVNVCTIDGRIGVASTIIDVQK